jgi:hypothetical protein
VTLHLLSQAGLFTYSSSGKWVFPSLLWSFPPTATFTSFPTPGCWVCAATPAFSSWLVRDSPPPSSALRVPSPLCYVSFFLLLLLIIQFFFSFFPGWGLVCPGGYADLAQGCLWEYHMLLSSPCGPHLPKPSGCWCLVAAQEPSWFPFLIFKVGIY